ncbi:heavy-metal-associated domain-containing protein [Corynebacterium glyciniphilum]|uniref:heavy-metal-associated domain-containing protein n=1 Tax=Corynebacterium glyciniphilum TaxID=1404244 RepID=UPI003DA1453E
MATTTNYQVTGMSCGHCEQSVRTEVSEIDGVTGVDVSAQTGHLSVTSEQPLDDAVVIAAVDEAGYAAVRS